VNRFGEDITSPTLNTDLKRSLKSTFAQYNPNVLDKFTTKKRTTSEPRVSVHVLTSAQGIEAQIEQLAQKKAIVLAAEAEKKRKEDVKLAAKAAKAKEAECKKLQKQKEAELRKAEKAAKQLEAERRKALKLEAKIAKQGANKQMKKKRKVAEVEVDENIDYVTLGLDEFDSDDFSNFLWNM
jgi:selenocysteine-specific translation elongation factor